MYRIENLKSCTDNDISELSLNDITGFYSYMNPSIKKMVLKYMRSFSDFVQTASNVYDVVKKEEVSGLYDFGFSDGVYAWYATDIYHLEKYNLKLTEEFVNHVLKQTGRSKP